MSLKNKIGQRFRDSSNWILNDPKSLVILMLMGAGIAFLLFGVFSTAFGFSKNWFLMGLFGLFSLISLKQFIKIVKMVKKAGLKNALGGITANEFVWHKNKYGGVEDGYEKNSKGVNTRSNKSDKEDEGGQRQDNRKPERTNIRFGEYIQLNDGNSKETTND